MRSVIVVTPEFDGVWPFTADHFARLWRTQGPVELIRLADDDRRPLGAIVPRPGEVTRLVCFGAPFSASCIRGFTELREAVLEGLDRQDQAAEIRSLLEERKVRVYGHPSEGFWGESVAEYGLAMTLCGLRRIPQLHRRIVDDLSPWDYSPPEGRGRPGARGQQYGDDSRFANGTVARKRVRIVGAGNIASRYASYVRCLGADVAAWDPFAPDPCFHRSGARKEWHLDRLVRDAEIFAPMVPLTDSTRGLVTRELIEALPTGCLIVMVTRARICDTGAIRERVLADEVALAADVFDVEPLPLDDPLLGRHNVVHSPHNAGRTRHANERYAEILADQFEPIGG